MRLTLLLKISLLAFMVAATGVGGVSWLSYQDVASFLRQQSLVDISDDLERETNILADILKKARGDVSSLAASLQGEIVGESIGEARISIRWGGGV